MKVFVLQCWDFRTGSGVQTAYLRLNAAQDAVRDFKHFGSKIRPVSIKTYEIPPDALGEALVELLHWGAGDVVPTLPEDWVVYERTLRSVLNFNFPIREVTQDVIDIERQDAGLVEDRAPTNWEQSRRGRNDGELNLLQAQDSANAHKVAQTVRGWRSYRADDGKLLIRKIYAHRFAARLRVFSNFSVSFTERSGDNLTPHIVGITPAVIAPALINEVKAADRINDLRYRSLNLGRMNSEGVRYNRIEGDRSDNSFAPLSRWHLFFKALTRRFVFHSYESMLHVLRQIQSRMPSVNFLPIFYCRNRYYSKIAKT